MKNTRSRGAVTGLLVLSLYGCTNLALDENHTFSTHPDNGLAETAIIFGMPRQKGSAISIIAVDVESGSRGDRAYDLGSRVFTDNRVIKVDRKSLPKSEHDKLGKSLNYRLSYGFRRIEPGDYAAYQIAGGGYVLNCLQNFAPTFRVKPGKINILDDIGSLTNRINRAASGLPTDDLSLKEFMSTILDEYSNIDGEIHIVEPVGIIDFDDPTSLGILRGRCASSEKFEIYKAIN